MSPRRIHKHTLVEHSSRYTIYLLTVWFDSPNNPGNASDPARWRFRLENPRYSNYGVDVSAFVVQAAATATAEAIPVPTKIPENQP